MGGHIWADISGLDMGEGIETRFQKMKQWIAGDIPHSEGQ